eukprot:6609661-Prymnesium_polylepis.1
MAAFAELGLCPELVRSVEEQGWGMPTPVQQETIPLILGGGDVLAAAETGSGKTGAFALPVLQITHEALREQQMQQSDPDKRAKLAKKTAAAESALPPAGVGDDRDGLLSVLTDGLECRCDSANAWAGGRACVGVTGGAYYYEVEQLNEGLCRLGWSSLAAKLALGTDSFGFGYGGTGKKSFGNKFDSFGEAYGAGDVIGCALDRTRGLISYFKNGSPLGGAFQIPQSLQRQPLFPAICLKGCAVRLNLGGAPLLSLPEGATPVASVASQHTATNSTAAGGGGSGADLCEQAPAERPRPSCALAGDSQAGQVSKRAEAMHRLLTSALPPLVCRALAGTSSVAESLPTDGAGGAIGNAAEIVDHVRSVLETDDAEAVDMAPS